MALLVIGGTLAVVGLLSSQSLITFFADGTIAAAILACATGLGLTWTRLLGMHRVEKRSRLLLSAGLGIGSLSLLVLALGAAGVMQRGVWIGILVAGAATGVYSLRRGAWPPKPAAMPPNSATPATCH